MQNKIEKIIGEEIKDSRGNPTIKVTVFCGEKSGSFSVPSGASTGTHEAHELRDEDGKGVNKAISNVNNIIAPALVGKNVLNQNEIDKILIKLDGTKNKDNLGGNAMIGVSIACAKVAAKISNMETFEYLRTLRLGSGQALAKIKPSRQTPYLFMNLLEGGKHADNGLAFQEHLVVPMIDNSEEAVSMGVKIQNTLKEMLEGETGEYPALGHEGGFMPKVTDPRAPFLLLQEAVRKNDLGNSVRFSIDAAASSFFEDSSYKVDGKKIAKHNLTDMYVSLVEEFKLFSIEDPFEQEDFESFAELREKIPNTLVVGDDLTVSRETLLRKAMGKKSINAMIIKPNQAGTLTETLETMKLARGNGIELIVSNRGEETDDDFIADLAYAFGCFGLKACAPTKLERMVKYNRLIKITNS